MSSLLSAKDVMSPDPTAVLKIQTPEWVKNIDLSPIVKNPPRAQRGTSYLLSDSQVRVIDGTKQNYRRYASLLTDSQSLTDNSQLQFSFDPSYQTLNIHQINIIRNGKTLDKLSNAAIKFIQKEEELDSLIYSGVVTALVVLDDVRVGDIIDYSYSAEGINPVYGGKYFGGFPLEWHPSVGLVNIRIIMPKGRPLQYAAYKSDIQPRIIHSGSETEYAWQISNTASIKDDKEYPTWHTAYAWLQVTEYEKWQEVVNWALNLYGNPENKQGSQEISNFLDLHKNKAANKKELIANVIDYVQDDIRYFGVEFGGNSHKPGKPTEVFNNRYGDCKDKSLLLHYLLSELNIKSSPVLVSNYNRRAIKNWLPSPGVFDHVILTFNYQGKDYWVDPTKNMQEGSIENLYISPFTYGLAINKHSSRLIDIPRNEIPNQIDVKETYSFSNYKSPVDLDIKTKYSGALSEYKRINFTSVESETIAKEFLTYYKSLYDAVSPKKDIQYLLDETGSSFSIFEEYSANGVWKKNDGYFSFEAYADTIKTYTTLPETTQRTTPIGIAYPMTINFVNEIIFPVEEKLDLEGANYAIEDDYIKFSRTVNKQGKKLFVKFNYTAKRDFVPLSSVEEHISVLKKINNELNYHIFIDDLTPVPTKSRLDRLRKLAN